MNAADYQGRRYIVTGASGGVGRAVSIRLAGLGAGVVLLARTEAPLRELAAALPGSGHRAMAADMANIAELDGLVAKIVDECGPVDGMVYCVGNGDICRLRDLSFERLHAVMLGNFYGYIQMLRSLCARKAKGARLAVVGISSLASTLPEKYFTAYSASKAAMEAAARCLALELQGRGVTINFIRPGVLDSPRVDYLNSVYGDIGAKIAKEGRQPMGLIPLDDAVELAVYLLGERARFINGASVPLNGCAVC